MKNYFLFLSILLFVPEMSGQKYKNCKNCTAEIQKLHLDKYTDTAEKVKLIVENWNETFFNKFWEAHNTPNQNIIPLKFDGIGCLYPENSIKPELSSKFRAIFANGKIDQFDVNSFYKISENTETKTQDLFWNSYLQLKKNDIINIEKKKGLFNEQMQFYEQWNRHFLNSKITEINNLVYRKGAEKVVFIAHGYNVPYSLAYIQYENIISTYASLVDTTKTLFLPVYWPSTNLKDTLIVNNKFYFKNKVKIKTIKDYDKITYRPILIGASLRKIVNELDINVKEIQMISHSLGAGIITHTLIPPTKFRLENSDRHKTAKELKLKPKAEKISVFMNAPAIGKTIFNDVENIDHDIIKKIDWFVGINKTDRVLTRPKIVRKIFPNDNDNTRLGAYELENIRAKEIFTKIGLEDNFNFKINGTQKDLFGHDFFCYLIQPLYQKNFENFIKKQQPQIP